MLQDIIIYFFQHYPKSSELSKARVVKMVYLADWKSAIQEGKQITNITWYYNHYGPYVETIMEEIRRDSRFELRLVRNTFDEPKEIIILKQPLEHSPNLQKWIVEILDFVIDKTSGLYWHEFIKLVYSTYPIVKFPKYSFLNLVEIAKEYNEVKTADVV